LPAVDFDDCLLGVFENAGTENDAEIAAVRNAIEMNSTKLFIGYSSITQGLFVSQPAKRGNRPAPAKNNHSFTTSVPTPFPPRSPCDIFIPWCGDGPYREERPLDA
jgi:hypothetical protein